MLHTSGGDTNLLGYLHWDDGGKKTLGALKEAEIFSLQRDSIFAILSHKDLSLPPAYWVGVDTNAILGPKWALGLSYAT